MIFDGRVALISGGLGDIGRAIALALAGRGAAVALCDLADAAPQALLDDLRALGRPVAYDRVDVRDAAAVADWVARTEAAQGTPNIIIPNAAVATLKDVLALTPDEWDQELSVNLSGAFYMAQAGARAMVAADKTGAVVFVGSWAAHAVHTHVPAYAVAKAGLRMLCRTMALELAPHGIRVNEVAPGYVDAGLSGAIFRTEPERRAAAEKAVPLGRLIDPAEVAAAVAYLCGPESAHTTGSVLLMDGGLSLRTRGTDG